MFIGKRLQTSVILASVMACASTHLHAQNVQSPFQDNRRLERERSDLEFPKREHAPLPGNGQRAQEDLKFPKRAARLPQDPSTEGKRAKILASDDEMMKLQKARYNAVVNEILMYEERMIGGTGESSQLYDNIATASGRLLNSGWEVFQTSEQRESLLIAHLELMKKMESIATARMQFSGSPEAAAQAEYWRIDAEIRLLKYRQSLVKSEVKGNPVMPCSPTKTH